MNLHECLNAGDRPFTLDVSSTLLPPCIGISMVPETVAPGQTADIEISYTPDPGSPCETGKVVRLPIILGGLSLPPSQKTLYVIFGEAPEISTEAL